MHKKPQHNQVGLTHITKMVMNFNFCIHPKDQHPELGAKCCTAQMKTVNTTITISIITTDKQEICGPHINSVT